MAKAQLHSKTAPEDKKNSTNNAQKSLEHENEVAGPTLRQSANNLEQSTSADIHILQRTIGNRAVQDLIKNSPQRQTKSTVIQRHVGDHAIPAGMATDGLLTASAENMGRGLGAVMSAQSLFQSYRAMAESTPVSESEETEGGEGHSYEF